MTTAELIEKLERADGPSRELGFARRYGPADSINNADAHRLLSLVDGYRATTGEAHCALGFVTVRELKRLPGWPSPLRWFHRTNVKGVFNIVSYHHRAQLCWEWFIQFSVGRAARGSLKPWRWVSWSNRHASFGIPWLFELRFARQPYGWMLSGDGENLIRFTAALKAKEADNG